jgi:hypothetical protein
MADGKNANPVTIEPIQNDVAAAAEVDQSFPKLGGHVFDRSSDTRLVGEDFDAGADCPDRLTSRNDILRSKEPVEPLNVGKSRWRPCQV